MARRSQKCENQNIVSAGNNVDKRPFIQAVYIHLKETDGIIIGVIPHKEFQDGWRLLSARPPPTLYGFRRSSSQGLSLVGGLGDVWINRKRTTESQEYITPSFMNYFSHSYSLEFSPRFKCLSILQSEVQTHPSLFLGVRILI